MAAPVITVAKNPVQDNWQRTQRFRTTITITNGTYPVGGIPIDSVLAAALMPTSNQGPRALQAVSLTGSGYVYDYIRATGRLMILQVPPAGSLTTAAPFQQLGSGANSLSAVAADVIQITVEYVRNA